jgi:hypothetical protein
MVNVGIGFLNRRSPVRVGPGPPNKSTGYGITLAARGTSLALQGERAWSSLMAGFFRVMGSKPGGRRREAVPFTRARRRRRTPVIGHLTGRGDLSEFPWNYGRMGCGCGVSLLQLRTCRLIRPAPLWARKRHCRPADSLKSDQV